MDRRSSDSRKPGSRALDRREFLQMAASAAAAAGLPGALFAQTEPAQTAAVGVFNFGHKVAATVPLDFNGLSYESPQLNNPGFFSAENTELVRFFRELAPTGGVLRIGGNLSEYTGWRDETSGPRTPEVQAAIDHAKNYFEWILVDQKAAKGRDAVITPAAIENLAAFCRATDWKLLYGLNFGTGTPERAAVEAACVQRFAGSSLLAFQLGNEIDFYKGGKRSQDWDFDRYYADYKRWTGIVRAKVPNAPFAGPDIAIRMDWVNDLAENEGKNVVLLTGHHYVMGPAGAPGIDAKRLLRPDPEAPGLIEKARQASAVAAVPFRMAEGNSCFHGGQPGVSNAFASALWGADYMLLVAQGGYAGVNLHGGGEGIYSPIVGDPEIGFTARPLYFGMQFAQRFAGAAMLESKLAAGKANITAYAARRQDDLLIAIVNKDATPAAIAVPKVCTAGTQIRETWKLSAPAIDSRTGVTFEKTKIVKTPGPGGKSDIYGLDPYSAVLLRFS